MAKKSRKWPLRSKMDDAGCMWGLISMFDFRQGHSTQRLLSDRKHGSGRYGGSGLSRSKLDLLKNFEEKHEDVNDVETREMKSVNLGMASIKMLIEEEMFRAHNSEKTSSPKVEQIRADLGLGVNLKNNHKQTINNFEVGSDHHSNGLRTSASQASCQSSCPNPSENSSFDDNLKELMVEFCRGNNQCQDNHVDAKSEINSYPTQGTIGDRRHNSLDEPDFQLSQKHSLLQNALGDLIKTFLTHKSTDSKPLASNVAVHQSKEFMDALETLKSNKELFVKLLQDRDSFLLKNIQVLQNAQSGECLDGSQLFKEIQSSGQHEETLSYNMLEKHSRHHFFRKKDKSKETKPLSKGENSQALSRIVVLKPSAPRDQHLSNVLSPCSSPQSVHSLKHQEDSSKVASHFSLKEIKKRLKHVIGESRKERHLITMDGLLDKIPYGFWGSADSRKTACNSNHTSQPSAKREDKKANLKEHQSQEKMNKTNRTTIAQTLYRESVFYEKARKNLAEVLSSDEKYEIPLTRQASNTLGRILSLPEYNLLSPRFSPGREPQSPQQMRRPPLWQFKEENSTNLSPSRQNAASSPCTDSSQDNGVQAANSDPAFLNTQLQNGEDLVHEGSRQHCHHLDVPSEVNIKGPGSSNEKYEEEGSSIMSEFGPSEEPQTVTSSISVSPNPLLIQKLEAPESIMENPDRPSPISVLEPCFSENSSPERTANEYDESKAQPRQLQFGDNNDSSQVLTSISSDTKLRISCMEDKEAELEYVLTVLEASGLSCNKDPERWHSSDQLLLDQSLFDEVEVSYDQLKDDPKLLFDCISEVLMDIQTKRFSCSPWISFIKPYTQPIPLGGNFIQEVCKGIDRHLHSPFPCTLDQLVRKDMNGDSWMDLRLETEGTVSEMGESILGYLMEETILELWE